LSEEKETANTEIKLASLVQARHDFQTLITQIRIDSMKHKLGIIFTLLTLLLATQLATAGNKLEAVTDFQALAKEMKEKNIGLLLEFNAAYCHFCLQLEEDILNPMLISGDYDDRILIKKLALDSNAPIIGFDGNTTSGAEFARQLKVELTPTLVFLDHQGNEIAERMLGINTPEMYGAYVDASIEDMEKLLLKNDQTPTPSSINSPNNASLPAQ
jgi:thioredoxin-related protein